MPARIARANLSVAAPKNVRKKNLKRNLDAYSIASHSTKEKRKVPQHRLGEVLDDGPRQKRRKTDDDDDEDGGSQDDDYESRPKAPRRQRQPDDEDEVEQGSDSSGNEWTLGGLAEDDEDSDLDSDEAFGESDEERFEGFKFRGSSSGKKKAVKKSKVVKQGNEEFDLSEGEEGEEEEEEDDFGDEGVDLVAMLDEDEDMADEDEESGNEEDDENSSSDEDEDDDAADEERVARLRDRLEGLDDEKVTAQAEEANGVLSIDDLLADLDPAARSQFSAALKTKKKSARPATLTAPLPKRQQDRLNREIATTKAKEQLDRWRDTVMHNRRAEFLTFPLQDPNQTVPLGKEKFVPNKPQTDLEHSIQRIMEESGISTKPGKKSEEQAEDYLLKAEEMATNKLPIEEVQRRRAELRRARELLFREEIKAKRIAKIKSKSYRRVHRKERERQAEKDREQMDPEGLGIPMDEDNQERFDRKRAEERMNTKHRESKWAKSLKATNRTVWDEGARDSVQDLARRNEELRKRIAGKEVNNGEEGDLSSGDSDIDDDDDNATTFRQLKSLQGSGDDADRTGLANMKFMRAADARRRAQNDEDVERMRKELAIQDGDEVSDVEIEDQGLGRAIFGPRLKQGQVDQPKTKKPELEEGDDSEDEAIRREQAERGIADIQRQSEKPAPKSILKETARASGPLARAPPIDQKKTSESEAGDGWLDGDKPNKNKKTKGQKRAVDQNEDLSLNTIIEAPIKDYAINPSQSKPAEQASRPNEFSTNTDSWKTVPFKSPAGTHSDASDSDADLETLTITPTTPTDRKKSHHTRAFAGDDVHAAFLTDKAALALSEDEKESSTHLPGWGSWAGTGLTKSIRKQNARQRHNPLYKAKIPGGVPQDKRRDKGREDVIISERKEGKVSRKFLAKEVPHGFEGKREVYERSLRGPVGPEWSTKEVFQKGTRPRVVVGRGRVVEAMEKPML